MESSRVTAIAPLSDGRLQAWSVDYNGNIWSREKTTTSSSSSWTPWVAFQGLEEMAITIAVAPLSDGRLQLLATDNYGKVWSCWKQTTESTSPWSPWTSFM